MTRSTLDRQKVAHQNRRRLQTLYLVAATGLAALIPLILFAGVWVRNELGKTQLDTERFLAARAMALSQQVDGDVEQQLAALRALSALPAFDDGAPGFEDAMRRSVTAMRHWSDLALVDPEDGRLLFSTAPRPPDPNLTAARRAAADRSPSIETTASNPEGRGGIDVYMPIVRNGGTTRVLRMRFDARDIQDILTRQPWDGRLTATIVDRDGRILARSRDPETTLGQPATPAFVQATTGRSEGLFQLTSREGEPVTGAFSRSALTGWLSSAQIVRSRTEGILSRPRLLSIAAGVLSLIVAGILAVFITHTLTERRANEERFAASKALGDLDARLLATSQEALAEQRKASSEREVLLREIYHRVKNNLQIVQSLLRLGSRELKPEQREPFESAVRRIGAMARVHTLLYNSPDLASIDFKDYLEELLRELSEGFAAEERAIESVLEAEAMRMPLDTAVPLAFIAVEILTNAFKHAFPEGRSGRIDVGVKREGGEAVLAIRDDGVGIAHEAASKRRLGLTIVRKLVQQIGGSLEEPAPGGSVFVIRFPLEAGGSAEPGASPTLASVP